MDYSSLKRGPSILRPPTAIQPVGRAGSRLRRLAAALLLLACGCYAQAATLTISGDITKFTDRIAKVYTLDEADFDRLPAHNITTGTDWTPKGTFRGPLLRDLLALVGARGSQVKFYGEDDYNITIPISDFKKYNVILANTWNGKPLKLEDYGPFWVMYPIPGMSPSETSGIFLSKLIWQVTRIEVK